MRQYLYRSSLSCCKFVMLYDFVFWTSRCNAPEPVVVVTFVVVLGVLTQFGSVSGSGSLARILGLRWSRRLLRSAWPRPALTSTSHVGVGGSAPKLSLATIQPRSWAQLGVRPTWPRPAQLGHDSATTPASCPGVRQDLVKSFIPSKKKIVKIESKIAKSAWMSDYAIPDAWNFECVVYPSTARVELQLCRGDLSCELLTWRTSCVELSEKV